MPALLFSIVSSAGCSSHPFSDENGLDKQLHFSAPAGAPGLPFAVGDTIPVEVYRGEGRDVDCVPNLRGGGDLCSGQVLDQKVTRLVHASCAPAACDVPEASVATNDAGFGVLYLGVRGLAEGETILSVTVALEDGETVTDRYPIRFLQATRLSVYCFSEVLCGGRYAQSAGSSLDWDVLAEHVGADGSVEMLAFEPHFESSDPAVAAIQDPSGPVVIELRSAGQADITIRGGGIERAVPLRVVDEEEIVGVDLRLDTNVVLGYQALGEEGLLVQSAPHEYWLDDPQGLAFDGATQKGSAYVVPVLKLGDGTEAIGSAERLHSTVPDFFFEPASFAGRFAIQPRDVGQTVLTGTFGGVSLSFPISVVESPEQ